MSQASDWLALLESTPDSLKPIQKFIKISNDIERLDPVIAYWCRFHSIEVAMQLDRNSSESKQYLSKMLALLEKFKQAHKDNDKVTQNVVAQANFENFVVALFNKADSIDRAGSANMNTVKMFYMASVLFEVLSTYGPLSDEVQEKIKYAKVKAAYIQKCLKSGETPKPGPFEESTATGDSQDLATTTSGLSISDNVSQQQPQPLQPQNSRPISRPEATSNTPATVSSQADKFLPRPAPAASNVADLPAGSAKLSDLVAMDGSRLTLDAVIKSQKYIKFATAAIAFNDVKNTVDNLEKALHLLKTGHD